MKKKISGLLLILIFAASFLFQKQDIAADESRVTSWEVQSIDTMKYSRDLSREKLNDASFDETIREQISDIASTGATHVAIATPYDEEFVPILTRWVKEARKQNLSVWFRGNFSGWEKWFGYDRITREQHLEMTRAFILSHPNLFQDGDIFTSCPECENGGSGDPRHTGDKNGFQQFLIDSYTVSHDSFEKIGKDVKSNYFSMNGDVANLVMDKKTTAAIDGIVVIDHYVKTPEKMINDIRNLVDQSGGKVVIGEFGAPIPDIHGDMSQEEQADWIDAALLALYKEKNVVGVNYWTSKGGSTELWKSGNKKTLAVETIKKYFDPELLEVNVVDQIDRPISQVEITEGTRKYLTDNQGQAHLLLLDNVSSITVAKDGYQAQEFSSINNIRDTEKIILVKENEGLFFRLIKFLRDLLS